MSDAPPSPEPPTSSSLSSPPSPPSPPRYHGLDALRAGAMALGVVLHAAAPYLRYPMEGLVWAVDGPPAGTSAFPWADALFWWLHAWRVPLFFVLAGFFAALLTERRGTRAFLRHRTTHILWPLLLACAVVLPVSYFTFAWGWTTTGVATWSEVLRLSFGKGLVKDDVLGPAHLWFLIYLYLFGLLYAAVVAIPGVRRALRPEGRLTIKAWWGVSIGLLALIAVWHPEVATSFDNDFDPRPIEFVYQACFFVMGVVLYAQRQGLAGLAARTGLYTCGAGLIGVWATVTTLRFLSDEPRAHAIHFGVAWVGCCCFTILALLAAAVRWGQRPRPWLRWLSDSAYWVYLTHVPVVAAVHVALHGTPVPVAVRFGLAVVLALGVTLATYRWFVRYTALGTLLHGRRERPAALTPSYAPPPSRP